MPGASDPAIEVIDISEQGLRLSTSHGEHFLSLENFHGFGERRRRTSRMSRK